MRSTAWKNPVTIEDPDTGRLRKVKTAREAQALLHRKWPDTAGSRYRDAEQVCESVVHGSTPSPEARKAFIAAAIEAHLHLG